MKFTLKKYLVFFCVVFGLLGNAAAYAEPAERSTAYQLYLEAAETLTQADSYLMAMDMAMLISIIIDIGIGDPFVLDMESESEIIMAIQLVGEDEFIMFMEMVTVTMDEEVEITAYFADGWFYMDTLGQKIKMEMSFNEAMAQAGVNGITVFEEEHIYEYFVEETEYGTLITFIIQSDAVYELIGSQMDLFEEFTEDGYEAEFSFSDMEYTALIGEDGKFVYIIMQFAVEMDVDGIIMVMDSFIHIDIIQVGGIEIEPPGDLDEYLEIKL